MEKNTHERFAEIMKKREKERKKNLPYNLLGVEIDSEKLSDESAINANLDNNLNNNQENNENSHDTLDNENNQIKNNFYNTTNNDINNNINIENINIEKELKQDISISNNFIDETITEKSEKNSDNTKDNEQNSDSIKQYIVRDQEDYSSVLFELEHINNVYLVEIKADTGLYRNALINAFIDCFINLVEARRAILIKVVSEKNQISKTGEIQGIKVSFHIKQKYIGYLLKLKYQNNVERNLIINKIIEYCREDKEFYKNVLKVAYGFHEEMLKKRKKRKNKKQ